jgi:hypothetical protein
MTSIDHAPWPSPTGVGAALDDVLCSVEPHRPRPPLTYLRRKPGRGLVAVYGSAKAPRDMYTVTVEESAVASDLVEPGRTPHHAALDEVPELVEIPPLGLTIQRFPHDERLPALAAAVTPYEHLELREALERTATDLLGTAPGTLRLLSADAVPLRYKPGDRCVLRYRLRLQPTTSTTGAEGPVQVGVIGKLYREPAQAHAAATLMTRLVAAQGKQPWTARPLAVVDALALVLSEDLGSDRDDPPTLVGTDVIRYGTAQPTQALQALRQAARALAELHTSDTATAETPARTGEDEAVKAGKRASTIARYVPTLAGETDRVASRLCTMLNALPQDVLRPAHGSYKSSQLLFRAGEVHLVDFDQFCRADPALDVGYFLAYLRPPGLWYHRAGTRAWFARAASTFLTAYDERLAERGVDASTRAGVRRRCHVYEAALLLKIAARRPNRLHSPRPGEVRALLAEVTSCLDAAEMSSPVPGEPVVR